jgi:hypothetical protein
MKLEPAQHHREIIQSCSLNDKPMLGILITPRVRGLEPLLLNISNMGPRLSTPPICSKRCIPIGYKNDFIL